MRSRAPALVAVVVFAVAVAAVAVLTGGGGGQNLVKLPVSSLGGASTDAASGTAEARSSLAYPGPVEYRVEGKLPDLPGTAPAYRLGAATTSAAVGRLATALGLDGEVKADDDGWVVRSGDRELRVSALPGLPWHLGPSCPDAPAGSDARTMSCDTAAVPLPAPQRPCDPNAACVVPAPAPGCKGGTMECLPGPVPSCPPDFRCVSPPPACPTDTGCIEPAPSPAPEKPARPAGLPSEADARRLVREAFARLDAGTDGFVMDDGWLTWDARVDTYIGGLPVIGLGTAVSIGPKGRIVRGSGSLAVPDRVGEYPLVGADAALGRLSSGFGGGGTRPLVATDQGAFTKGAIEPAMPECDTPAVGCVAPPMPAPMVQVVTGVHLALLQFGDVLVPAYDFELAGGGSVPVPAVTDEWLDHQAPDDIGKD